MNSQCSLLLNCRTVTHLFHRDWDESSDEEDDETMGVVNEDRVVENADPTSQQACANSTTCEQRRDAPGLQQKFQKLLTHNTEWGRFMGVVRGPDDWDSDLDTGEESEGPDVEPVGAATASTDSRLTIA
jgi:hypothetical protein